MLNWIFDWILTVNTGGFFFSPHENCQALERVFERGYAVPILEFFKAWLDKVLSKPI